MSRVEDVGFPTPFVSLYFSSVLSLASTMNIRIRGCQAFFVRGCKRLSVKMQTMLVLDVIGFAAGFVADTTHHPT